ncbi:hypothetical protein LCGC14_2746530, partial [marine sediment metagenome]
AGFSLLVGQPAKGETPLCPNCGREQDGIGNCVAGWHTFGEQG